VHAPPPIGEVVGPPASPSSAPSTFQDGNSRQHPPWTTALQDIEAGVEYLAGGVGTRVPSLVGGRNVGLDALPFGVAKIGRVGLSHASERTSATRPARFFKQFL